MPVSFLVMENPPSDKAQPKQAQAVKRPGDILFQEFMRPLGLTAYRVSKELGVAPITVSEILRGMRSISPSMACRLATFFETHPVFWLALQATYDVHLHQNNGTNHDVAPCRHLNGRKLGPAEAHKSVALWQACWICREISSDGRSSPAAASSAPASNHPSVKGAAQRKVMAPAGSKKDPKSLTSGKNT